MVAGLERAAAGVRRNSRNVPLSLAFGNFVYCGTDGRE
jgi:hypothetical protein